MVHRTHGHYKLLHPDCGMDWPSRFGIIPANLIQGYAFFCQLLNIVRPSILVVGTLLVSFLASYDFNLGLLL